MIAVRRIKPSDNRKVRALIDAIMHEEFASIHHAYARHDIEDPAAYYSGDKDVFLVAEENGEIIGTVAIKEDSPTSALLRRIFVRREYRGRGCGDLLMRKALEFCFDRHYQNVTFRGTDQMQQALKLCLKQGFAEDDIVAGEAFKMFVLSKRLEKQAVATA